MRGPQDVERAVAQLWTVVPVGYGKDFATLIKYVEKLQMQLNEEFE